MSTAPPRSGSIAVIAALPRELALLSRRLRASTLADADGILLQSASLPGQPSPVLLATAGMGASRAALAVAAALAHGPISTLLSVGLAGACAPNLLPGDVLAALLVVDTNSGERFTPDAPLDVPSKGILVTTPDIASPAEKRRLQATYNAAAVDMEAATVARLGRAHNISFAALKAISDEHDLDLTHLSSFANTRGHFRTAAFALHTTLRPHRWRSTASLGRNTSAALRNLAFTLHDLLLSPPRA